MCIGQVCYQSLPSPHYYTFSWTVNFGYLGYSICNSSELRLHQPLLTFYLHFLFHLFLYFYVFAATISLSASFLKQAYFWILQNVYFLLLIVFSSDGFRVFLYPIRYAGL